MKTNPLITIREAIESDKEQLTQVSREAHASLRKVYRLRPEAKQIGTDVPYTRIVAIKDGVVAGMATYEVEENALYFGSLGVLEAFRCQGIARSLVEHIENAARETGFLKISCATIEETGNVPIFEKLGFTVTSRENADKFESVSGTQIHEVKMEKILKSKQHQLRLEPIGLDQENILQDIYNHSPTYFRRVDGTDPLPGMAKKDIEDIPQNRSKTYKKVAALIFKDFEPIGYADLHINHRTDGVAYLGLLLLKESEQGKGIGRKAYHLIENYLSQKFNIKTIVLGVSDKNQVQAYWEKMGFKPNGCTYVWKGERVESTVTEMEKSLETLN